MILIALTGGPDSGEDLVAALLQEAHGRKSVRISFHDLLREEICWAYRCPMDLLTHPKLRTIPTPTLNINNCRTQGFRDYWNRMFSAGALPYADGCPELVMRAWCAHRRYRDFTYFVRAALNAWTSAEDSGAGLVVVTDLNYANEALAVCSAGGKIWRVVKPNTPASQDQDSQPLRRWPDDERIINDGDVSLLRKKVRDLYFTEVGRRACDQRTVIATDEIEP